MKNLTKSLIGVTAVVFASMAQGTVITNLEDATNGGGFFGAVTFENNGLNTVTVTANVAAPINAGLTNADILGLWFDFNDFSSLSGPITFSSTVLDFEFGENSVGSSLGGNVNLNGSGATNWDLAVEVGENGSDGGFIQSLSFDITIAGLDETAFLDQRVGMRVQSIEGLQSFNGGSSKLLDVTVPEPGSLALLALGLVGLGVTRKMRR